MDKRYQKSEPHASEPVPVAGRVPPHDLDAEASVLSAVLLERDAQDKVLEILKPNYFYSDPNRRIFQGVLELALAGDPVDITTVAAWLRSRDWINHIGGPSYLAQLVDATPAVTHVDAHARVVAEKWRLRQLIGACQRIAAEGYGDVGTIQEFIEGAEESIHHIVQIATKSSFQPIGHVLKSVFEALHAAAERGDRLTGLSTGFGRLDDMTAGLQDGDLTIVAARPGMGKTSFVLNMAVNVASPRAVRRNGVEQQEPGDGVCVFSLEMPREQLGMRTTCSEGRVDLGKVKKGMLQADDWRRLTDAAAYLNQLPIFIDDTPGIGLMELRAKARRMQAEYNRPAKPGQPERRIGLVIVDYLQLMKGREGAQNREQEISEISRGLKELAKELRVPVIALSQLNRAVEGRTDKRPQLSDLRESGAIEQDADLVMFIYRDDYYNENSNKKGIAEIIIAKQRNGPTGKVLVRFASSYTRFDNLASTEYPDMED
ncbi:MAG: replicative DNA helicase [Polyangiaceae bacterium]|nr:replicative DNA helicase [Polyangiaceae bacterium]